MNDYGDQLCSGDENGIVYKIYLNDKFKYTIFVKKGDVENIKHYQGINSIFGLDAIDIQEVNKILDEMINKIKSK